jgi:hypothetical protein
VRCFLLGAAMNIEEQIATVVERAVAQAVSKLVDRLERVEQLAEHRRPDRLLYSESEAAAALGVAPVSLKAWRCKGHIRAHSKCKPILYRWADIEAAAEWLAGRAAQ